MPFAEAKVYAARDRVKRGTNCQNAYLGVENAQVDDYDRTILLREDEKVWEEARACFFSDPVVQGGSQHRGPGQRH